MSMWSEKVVSLRFSSTERGEHGGGTPCRRVRRDGIAAFEPNEAFGDSRRGNGAADGEPLFENEQVLACALSS